MPDVELLRLHQGYSSALVTRYVKVAITLAADNELVHNLDALDPGLHLDLTKLLQGIYIKNKQNTLAASYHQQLLCVNMAHHR